MTAEMPHDPSQVSGESRGWAAGAHLAPLIGLGFIGPLIVWLVKRDEDRFAELHAREALNFQLSLLLYAFIAMALLFLSFTGVWVFIVIAVIAFVAIGIMALVLAIVAGVKGASGDLYRYPLTIRFVGPYPR